MGLIANIKLPSGVPMGYHRILSLVVEVNQLDTIWLMSYINKEERDAESEEYTPYREQWFVEQPYDPEMSVNKAYAYLKTLAEFDGATDVIDPWKINMAYYTDDLVTYDDDLEYICLQPHTSQEGWEPPNVPALWKVHHGTDISEWVQPTGAQDAYMKDDLCTHNGKTWRSDVNDNVWEPGVYGWTEVEV